MTLTNDWEPRATRSSQRKDKDGELEKLIVLLVITGHGEGSFSILLLLSGPLTDVDAVQELPDVLSDRGGPLEGPEICEGQEQTRAGGR